MEITKCLQEDILKIQNELRTAIQNHQVLVLRQQVSPSDSVKTQIEEVQRHIICLGESQKILVSRLQNELQSKSLQVNNNHKTSVHQQAHIKSERENDILRKKQRSQDLSRSLLNKDTNKEQLRVKFPCASDSETSEQNSLMFKERHPSADSSSEENRTPCQSPISQNNENKRRGTKRTLSESHRSPNKRPKSTLQVAPRPSSPVPARSNALDVLSSCSDESLDSLMSQQQETENVVDFALALGLVTKDVYSKVIKKKSDRRKRRSSNQNQHRPYNNSWDLTLQKRNQEKEPEPKTLDDASRDCDSSEEDLDSLCFICQTAGDLKECAVCQTGCHVVCIRNNICPACTHRFCSASSSPLIQEKKKELEQLRLNNRELHKSVSKLREKAKELSASLVMQTATMTQLSADKDKIDDSIKRIKDFLASFQGPSNPVSTIPEPSGPITAK